MRPDALTIWYDDEVKRRLSWYRKVMVNELPAKFVICKKIQAEDLIGLKENELWNMHNKLQKQFTKIFKDIVKGEKNIVNLKNVAPNFLSVKVALAEKIVEKCAFCERKCHVNRKSGGKGFCRIGYAAKISTWFHHFGEEAPLIGEGGSGTIFFSGCNFGPCAYCQNWDISSNAENGTDVSPRILAMISEKLRKDGAANINYVGGEPTPNLHVILSSLQYLKTNVPLLWNSNMYCSTETMSLLSDIIDIWLPDFKYSNNNCAKELSKVNEYFEVVSRNHKIAHDSGNILIRHLVLPAHLDCCTKPILKWISENLPNALVNIMGQYHPDYLVSENPNKYKSVAKRISSEEMAKAYDYAEKFGIIYKSVS